ncbi:MAG: acyl-[acyl-carrier-protein] thioesterase [Ruminococcaceae bacterium]|nr:acyl-[acyl-carrier-protein] thioesterase [Oscillospiraceae bacterium]
MGALARGAPVLSPKNREERDSMIHRERFCVDFHDTDLNGIASASALMRRMQEAANRQLQTYGPTVEELKEQNKAFILSRMCMSVYKPLHAFEEIEAETWAAESKGMSFNRCSRIKREGQIVAEAIWVFALVDTLSRRLCRVEDNPFSFGSEAMLELDMPKRVMIPSDLPMTLVGEYTASYADCDRNGHMNNTVYADRLCGFLPEMRGKRVSRLMLHYLSEAPLGRSFKVYRGQSDGIHYLRTVREDGSKGVEAEIVTEDIE